METEYVYKHNFHKWSYLGHWDQVERVHEIVDILIINISAVIVALEIENFLKLISAYFSTKKIRI